MLFSPYNNSYVILLYHEKILFKSFQKKSVVKKRKKEIEKLISKSIYLCLQEQH